MQRDEKKNEVLSLYDLYSRRVLKFIFTLTKDYHTAEDLTHETFIKVYNSYGQLKNKDKVESWIFRIAHNITMDYMRRKKFNIFEHYSHQYREKEANNTLESAIMINESFQELYEALGKLKPSYREVVILRKIEGMSTKETCEILGWSESKVKSTLLRALKALQQELSKGEWVYE
ncbi:RNA polymerase sigma factor [Cytobacillus sp. IB215316]|uniref:RNA polymerase sigma factor n=1 Tax=Cytobacillus sp. IB215316 TaxID=3097354 RepID=UPI002A1253B0|nr:RNA polymerase sigma factor [Cytobacillus sp. IB215316]MDX8360788.1 RNA polymerase sigma factor [Cytobacillus sp. IB215316]